MGLQGYNESWASGQEFENEVLRTVQKFTQHFHQNIRIQSPYTRNGATEIDIVAALGDCILILELKNVSEIRGSYASDMWTMVGSRKQVPFTTLNVLTQNRIHLRSFKNMWARKYQNEPAILALTVVPNNCSVPHNLVHAGVVTHEILRQQLASIFRDIKSHKYGYALTFLLNSQGIQT